MTVLIAPSSLIATRKHWSGKKARNTFITSCLSLQRKVLAAGQKIQGIVHHAISMAIVLSAYGLKGATLKKIIKDYDYVITYGVLSK